MPSCARRNLDLDALIAFAKAAVGDDGFALPQEATLALDIGKATLRRRRRASGQRAGQVRRRQIADRPPVDRRLGGGEARYQRPDRRIVVAAARAGDARSRCARARRPRRYRGQIRAAAPPMRCAAPPIGWRRRKCMPCSPSSARPAAGSTAELQSTATWRRCALPLNGKATGEPAHLGAATMQIDSRIDADDGTRAGGAARPRSRAGVDQLPGRLTLSAAGPLNGDIHVDGKVAASGFDSAIAGDVALDRRLVPSGKLQLQASAGDLRPLQQTHDRTARRRRSGLGARRVGGRRRRSFLHRHRRHRRQERGARAVSLSIGQKSDRHRRRHRGRRCRRRERHWRCCSGCRATRTGGTAMVERARSAPARSRAMNGAVTFKLDRAVFTPALVASDLKGVAHFQPVRDRPGRYRRQPRRRAHHRRVGVPAAIPMGSPRTASRSCRRRRRDDLRPSLNATDGTADVDAAERRLRRKSVGLIGSLHGSGTLTLKDVHFAGLDPAAFDAAMQAAGQAARSMCQGPGCGERRAGERPSRRAARRAAIDDRVGHAQPDDVTLQAQGGSRAFAQRRYRSQQRHDRRAHDAFGTAARERLDPHAAGAFRHAQRSVRGAAAHARHSALTSWLTLSAAELQTRRIESIEASRYEARRRRPSSGLAGCARGPAGARRRIRGAAESVGRARPGARGLERLQPPAPPALPEQSGPGSEGAAPAVPCRCRRRSRSGRASRARRARTKNTATIGRPEQTRRRPRWAAADCAELLARRLSSASFVCYSGRSTGGSATGAIATNGACGLGPSR